MKKTTLTFREIESLKDLIEVMQTMENNSGSEEMFLVNGEIMKISYDKYFYVNNSQITITSLIERVECQLLYKGDYSAYVDYVANKECR